jgi:hypothetical protein
MALEATFRQLSVSLHKLHDALNALHVTVGDKPPDDEAALADGLENAVLDLMGTLHEARKSSMEARRAVGAPVDLDRARRALMVCQKCFHRMEQTFAAELVSYERLSELARLGRARRREWLPWAGSTKAGIEQCREPLELTSKALAGCWEELAERLGTTNISMQATNVGQQITLPKSHIEDLEVEGVT